MGNFNYQLLKVPQPVAVAIEVINGLYGTGAERVKNLEKCGYNSKEIQDCVNVMYPLFEKYGDV